MRIVYYVMRRVVTHFCSTCKDKLCDPCCKAHRIVKITKHHDLVPLETKVKTVEEVVENLANVSIDSRLHSETETITKSSLSPPVMETNASNATHEKDNPTPQNTDDFEDDNNGIQASPSPKRIRKSQTPLHSPVIPVESTPEVQEPRREVPAEQVHYFLDIYIFPFIIIALMIAPVIYIDRF